MSIESHFKNYWNQRRFYFLYDEKHQDIQRDFEELKSKCEAISVMEQGETVVFSSGIEMKVFTKSSDRRFVALVSENGASYSIVDTKFGVAGPTDRTFQLVDFKNINEVNELLDRLRKGEFQLSYRNSAPIDKILKL